MLTSTALVLLMTLPGLALFYGGLVRTRNVLSVLMQCFALCCVISLIWVVFGYSLAFDAGSGLARRVVEGVARRRRGRLGQRRDSRNGVRRCSS